MMAQPGEYERAEAAMKTSRVMAKIKKLGGVTVGLIVILVLLAVGFGALMLMSIAEGGKQNEELKSSLEQIQQ
jgi:flagellar basal body-associated protein FliL